MGLCRWYLGVLVLVLACAGRAEANDEGCFDFASPTLDSLFQASVAQRMLIVVRTPEVDARMAAKGLSLAARRRGVETTIMRISQASSARDLAVEEARASQAQMVAIIEVVSGSEPKMDHKMDPMMASSDFRDRSGQRLAVLSAVRAQSAQCRTAGAVPSPRGPEQARAPGMPADELEEQEADTPDDLPPSEGPGRTWYGWQLMLADAASVAVLLSPVPSFAVPTYLLGRRWIGAVPARSWRWYGRSILDSAIRNPSVRSRSRARQTPWRR
jgi:hypothetical protein